MPQLAQLFDNLQTALRFTQGNKSEALITFYTHNQGDEKLAAQTRLAMLLLIKEDPSLLRNTAVAEFLMSHIESADFEQIEWQTDAQMLEFCEMLYSFPFASDSIAEQVHGHVRHLLQNVLRRLEEQKEWEQLFRLVEIAPTSSLMADVELRRLRHLARAYELRRVERNRRILYAYLAIQVLLVMVIFPLLFINAENGALQRQVEKLADVEIGDEGYRLFTYTDGVYWAIITAASIGYGDITPVTTTGKFIAATLGTLGVVTVGVIAGLVLKWITPRTLD
ncbi:MAG: potassium channel family protein [Caldilineaceae bacterium]